MRWWNDDPQSQGASIAYYTVFSMAPLLLLVIAVAGIIFGRDEAQRAILEEFRGMMGAQGTSALETVLSSANASGNGVVATVISIVLLLIGATSVLGNLREALNKVFRADPPTSSGVWRWIRDHVASLSLIGAAGFLLAASLVVSTVLTALNGWIAKHLSEVEALLFVVEVVVSVGLLTVLFAAIYMILPNIRLSWRSAFVGGFVTSAFFNVGKYAIALYISMAHVASAFGASGALIVLLVWVYYSAQIFLLGAEFTAVYAGRPERRRVDAGSVERSNGKQPS
ncbi:MAG: YihY/virulence factor BrkB family protein [Hyphomicrobiales bacterium]